MISLVLIEKRVNAACRNKSAFKLVRVITEKMNIFLPVHSFMISFKPKKDGFEWDLVTITFWC